MIRLSTTPLDVARRGLTASRISAGLVLAATSLAACGRHTPPAIALDDRGLPRCPRTSTVDFTAPESLQCWFRADHGMWRILSQESHYTVLVARVEAIDARDARAIARRFVEAHKTEFAEILVYLSGPATARPEHADPGPHAGMIRTIRRVRWTTENGFETLEFNAQAQ